MKPLAIAILGALLCASLPAQQGAVTPSHTNLKVGDMAPDFTLPATTGDKVTLSSFRGKAPVVLAFFPAAFTGGCSCFACWNGPAWDSPSAAPLLP